MFIVNSLEAAALERLGWVAGRDFAVSDLVPVKPLDLAAMSKRLNQAIRRA